ncbi:MAG TPA: T9SS type A sorting domain-containing protein, partial [Bacteroidia bacterium]|nr:T9SS type A sorting domain-containing protein [Bacteroidia bacterium]
LTQTFTTPVNDTIFTAIYDSLQLSYNLGNDTAICINNTLTLDAGANYSSYAWSDGSVNRFLSIQSPVPDTIAIGVSVTNANGLTGNDSINVIIEICSSVGTLENDPISIFPNPSSHELTISELPEKYYLNVTNMNGQEIISHSPVPANQVLKIKLPPGVYSLLLLSETGQALKRENVVIAQ